MDVTWGHHDLLANYCNLLKHHTSALKMLLTEGSQSLLLYTFL
jgi:hypothetical protein